MIDETINIQNFLFSSETNVNEWLSYVAEKTNWLYKNEDINYWGKLYFECGDVHYSFTINRLANSISSSVTGYLDEEIHVCDLKYKTTKDIIDICLKIAKKIKENELERKKKELNRDFYLEDYDYDI